MERAHFIARIMIDTACRRSEFRTPCFSLSTAPGQGRTAASIGVLVACDTVAPRSCK